MADQFAVLVVAEVIVEVAAAQEKLFADEEGLDLVLGDFGGFGRWRSFC